MNHQRTELPEHRAPGGTHSTAATRRWSSRAFLVATVLVCATAMLAVGCGGDEEEASAEEQGEAATAEATGPMTNAMGETVYPCSTNPNEFGDAQDEQKKAAAGKPKLKKPMKAKRMAAKRLAELAKKKQQAKKGEDTAAAPGDIPAPDNVAAPPKNAKKTASGLASIVLKKGSGNEKPGPNDTVKVHYTGWTTDGKMFDSSIKRGKPAEFPLGGVIPGWTEGLQLMTVGEKRRFWIPEELAYKGKPNRPQGMLVFDVELLETTSAPEKPENLKSPAPDAKTTASGLATKVLKKGKGGATPGDSDTVKLHYTGWFDSGKMFDSTKRRGQPLSVPVDKLFDGWKEGVKLMTVGEKRRLWIPRKLAPERLPGMDEFKYLILDVELLDVVPAPKAPANVAAPPADAKKTKSGLASKVLKKGTGSKKPKATDTVEVHYTGWTTDGKMFDSSVVRGKPARFPLAGVIPGWTEGLQLMVEGEKRRLWIPEELAYKGKPNRPQGMLVFDVELIKIH